MSTDGKGPERRRVSPIRPQKAAQLLTDELRRLIVHKGQPGDALPPERILMESFSISRPTLREAIRVLESEGLIEVRRGVHGGAVMKRPSIDDLARRFGLYVQGQGATGGEIFSLRRIIEPVAAALAAEHGAQTEERLTRALDTEAEMIERASRNDDVVSDVLVGFHDVVLELSGNRALAALGQLLDAIVEQHVRHYLRTIGSDRSTRVAELKKSHAAHRRIAEAVITGDPDEARRISDAHLAAVEQVTMSDLVHLPIDIIGQPLTDVTVDWSGFTTSPRD